MLADPAVRALARMAADRRRLIRHRIDALAADPHGPQPQVKPLEGPLTGLRRLRVGDWRVLFRLDDRARLVRVLAIEPRGGVHD
jgi:mRNA interferase RelE/StbE